MNHNQRYAKIEIENSSYQTALSTLRSIIADSKQETCERINRRFSPELKSGWGGSHIWISDRNNNRVAIITNIS